MVLPVPNVFFDVLLPRRTCKMAPISRRKAPSGAAAKILAWEGPPPTRRKVWTEIRLSDRQKSGISFKSFFSIINQPNAFKSAHPWFCLRHRFERSGSVKLRVSELKRILRGSSTYETVRKSGERRWKTRQHYCFVLLSIMVLLFISPHFLTAETRRTFTTLGRSISCSVNLFFLSFFFGVTQGLLCPVAQFLSGLNCGWWKYHLK